jgi:hypothetical protein
MVPVVTLSVLNLIRWEIFMMEPLIPKDQAGLFIMGTQLLGSPTRVVVMDFREITTGGSLPEI